MTTNKKIAFIIHGLPMGGAEKFLILLANHFFKVGYQPQLILLSKEYTLINELNKNIPVFTVLKKNRFDVFVSWQIKKIIEQQDIKKVFCINTYSFFLTKLSFIFNTNIHFFLSPHSTIPISIKNYWQNMLYVRFISSRDTVIYLCHNQKKYLEQKYLFSTTLNAIVYNGINTNYYHPSVTNYTEIENLKQFFSIPNTTKIIVQVARIQPEKSHIDAVDALYYLHHQLKLSAHLVLVGTGEKKYIDALMQHIQKLQLQSFIHFAGNQNDVRKYYAMADIFTLTSYSETFSLAAIEAMAFGLPCSLTNVGGAKEMIIEGVTGLITQPNNIRSIAESWKNLLEKNLQRESIINYVHQHFNATKMMQQYIQLVR